MPRADKHSTLARQWELLRLIPSHLPGLTVSVLRKALEEAGYEVTKRTVERDLAELTGVFPLQCNAISKPYGWYWEPGAQLEIPGMDLAEALTLGLLEEVLRPLVPEAFVRGLEGRFGCARKKLASLAGNQRAQWNDLVRYLPPGQQFLPPTVLPRILREVQDGLLSGHQLRVTYQPGGSDNTKELDLHPLAFLQQGVRSYLVATTFDYEDVVIYALHRFISVEVLPDKATRPEGFTLDDYLNRGGGQFGERGIITLKATLTDALARLLEETPLSADQRIMKGKEGRRLTATVFDSWQLRFWILSQGAELVVRQPAALRNEIMARIDDMKSAYQRGKGE